MVLIECLAFEVYAGKDTACLDVNAAVPCPKQAPALCSR